MARAPANRRALPTIGILAVVAQFVLRRRARQGRRPSIDVPFRVAEPQTNLPHEALPVQVPSVRQPLAAPPDFIPSGGAAPQD